MRTKKSYIAACALVAALGVQQAPAAPAPKPAKPTVATTPVQNLTQTSVTLTGTVNPKGSPTSFQFQYGTTKNYGSTSGLVGTGSGTTNVPVTANISGLTPNTTYHYRLAATNAVGTSMTGDKTFTTGQQAGAGPGGTTITLSAAPSSVRFGGSTTLSGQLTGGNVANQQVTLQSNPFPYGAAPGGFKNVGNAVTTDATGKFTFPAVTGLNVNTQFQATTGKSTTSPVVIVGNKVLVGLSLSRTHVRKGRRVRFSGNVTPAEDGALYAIQRRSNGHWVTVAGGALVHSTTPNTSHYSRRVRIRNGGSYRVFVAVTEGGHVSNTSAVRRITLI